MLIEGNYFIFVIVVSVIVMCGGYIEIVGVGFGDFELILVCGK